MPGAWVSLGMLSPIPPERITLKFPRREGGIPLGELPPAFPLFTRGRAKLRIEPRSGGPVSPAVGPPSGSPAPGGGSSEEGLQSFLAML